MSTIIHLANIEIQSSSNPHDDLPPPMQLFSQLIVDGTIIQETMPVDSEDSTFSWKLRFDCEIPPHAPTVLITVLRKSQGIRLLGSGELSRDVVLSSVEQQRATHLPLAKVNVDGPMLHLTTVFSISSSSAKASVLETTDIQGIQIGSVNSQSILTCLKQWYDDTKSNIWLAFQDLWVMHERILLLPIIDPNRGRCLNLLGDISLMQWKLSRIIDLLNQGVCAYDDAVRDGLADAGSLHDLGIALKYRAEEIGDLRDITKSVSVMQDVVELTPDNHPEKPSRLSNLGTSLLTRFKWLGNMDDLKRSVLVGENAIYLSPDGDTKKPSRLNNLGTSLLARFEHLGDLGDLNRSISIGEDAVHLTPEGHPSKPSRLTNLGNSLQTRFQYLEDLDDLKKSVSIREDAVHLTPMGHLDRPLMLNNLGSSLQTRFKRLGDLNDLSMSISITEESVRLTQEGHPDKPVRLSNLRLLLQTRFTHLGDLGDLSRSVLMAEEVVHLTPDSHPDKPKSLDNLGSSLLTRFKRFGELDDLNRSVSMREKAIHRAPDAHVDKPSMMNNLGNSLLIRFERLGDLSDLNKSVLMGEDALRLTPDNHPAKPLMRDSLVASLFRRFERLGDLSDLNKSLLMSENALRVTPDGHPDKPALFNNLALSLVRRFERLGDLKDINKAVSMAEDAVRLTPDGDPGKPSRLTSVGNVLLTRFEHMGQLDDLSKAVLIREDVVRLTPDDHPNKPSSMSKLATSLQTRFERLGSLGDLTMSVSMGKDAIHLTPEGHPDKPYRLNNLSSYLLTCFERLGNLDDLHESVLMGEDAVYLTPDGHPDKPSRMNNLGRSLLTRFEHLGNLDDLNKSVWMGENAVRLTPDGHQDKPWRLNNLGGSLFRRFERLGDLGDLSKAISIREDIVTLIPENHPHKPSVLNNLGNCLSRRFERLGGLDDLNRSVLVKEDALRMTPDGHPYKPSMLTNVASSLLTRFKRLGDLDDLNRSVLTGEDAASLTPDGHPNKASRLNNLGGSLFSRFKSLNAIDDLDRCLSIGKDVVGLTPDGHPEKPMRLNNLATLFYNRFLHSVDHSALQQAICHYKHAARSITGPTHIRFHAASRWAQCAIYGEDPSLLDAYHVALNLLPELAWLGLSINDRHYHILKAGEVVRNAAAAAISFGQPEKAVEWLEQGRSVIWGQLLNLRTPVDTLSSSHPELAQRLLVLSAQLEGSGTRADSGRTESGAQDSLQSTADQAHQNAHDRDKLLKQIRALEGFSRFLLPRTITELSKAAQHGPVVILNVSKTRCDALALMPGRNEEVLHIQLDDFKPKDAESQAKSLDNLVYHRGRSERLVGRRDKQQDPEEEFANHLSELWFRVVKPVLEGLAIKNPTKANCPHIWWCPTGPLAFLPIHAAGLYGTDDAHGSKLSDFVISSYTPSLTALIEGFRPPSEAQQTFQLLAVSQPSASGQAYIPGTREEITRIQQLANGKLPVLSLDGHMATVDSVQQGMRDSRWVHFACHGVQDVSHPTESALLLAGSSRLTLSSIIQLALPHADLAFLSACQTATGDKSLQEEAVHLAAGMLLAGYRSVIATMWTISDRDAPQVASDFYEHLFKTLPPDPAQAAEALHLAVQKLRKDSGTKKSFLNWVPFIHVGV